MTPVFVVALRLWVDVSSSGRPWYPPQSHDARNLVGRLEASFAKLDCFDQPNADPIVVQILISAELVGNR